MKRLLLPSLFILSGFLLTAQPLWLDQLDKGLKLESPNGFFRSDLSVLFDLEAYHIDQRPPGLIFDEDDRLNPRLTLFLDTRLGKYFYSLVQFRVDRGFDPGVEDNDHRFDEYLLRYQPWGDARLSLQAGKFATVVGNWVPRHDSWQNPFITAPAPYENVTTVSDFQIRPGGAALVRRKKLADNKRAWVPILWGPSYASGFAAFGSIQRFDYAVELKNAAISSRPSSWDYRDVDLDNPTVSARLGYRPSAAWNLGISASGGAYLAERSESAPAWPSGDETGDYRQLTLAQDLSYAHGHWQLWGELFLSRFEVPNVGDADTAAYYLESKYKLSLRSFLALRWNQQFFGEVPNGRGGKSHWDNQFWRIDSVFGYRFGRHLQTKLQYSYTHHQGDFQQGEQLVAGQMTLKF